MDLYQERASLREALNIHISAESYVLAFICVVDMVSTILLVRAGKAVEANPVLVPFMDAGIGWFFVAKCMFFMVPLFALELLRSKRPDFVKKMLRFGIAAYILSYGIGVARVNHRHADDGGQIASRSAAPISQSEVNSTHQ